VPGLDSKAYCILPSFSEFEVLRNHLHCHAVDHSWSKHVSSLAPVPIFHISYSRSARRNDDVGNKVEQHRWAKFPLLPIAPRHSRGILHATPTLQLNRHSVHTPIEWINAPEIDAHADFFDSDIASATADTLSGHTGYSASTG
jgi:hypothetical protein